MNPTNTVTVEVNIKQAGIFDTLIQDEKFQTYFSQYQTDKENEYSLKDLDLFQTYFSQYQTPSKLCSLL
jgi:hypothetical protein